MPEFVCEHRLQFVTRQHARMVNDRHASGALWIDAHTRAWDASFQRDGDDCMVIG